MAIKMGTQVTATIQDDRAQITVTGRVVKLYSLVIDGFRFSMLALDVDGTRKFVRRSEVQA